MLLEELHTDRIFFCSFDGGGVKRSGSTKGRSDDNLDVGSEDFVWVCKFGLYMQVMSALGGLLRAFEGKEG